jgi:uncharacterized protein (DUF608 family)
MSSTRWRMAALSGAGRWVQTRSFPPSFALLECFDYAYYATLDVRFYASLPLLKFWPDIDKQVLREFADTVPREWPEKGLWVWKTQQTGEPVLHKRKKKGAVPHDLGVPEGDPFIAVNQPGWQDTNDWKDLNSKFVLMIYRDYVFTGRKDTAFLRETWPAVKEAISYLRQFDHGGGVPENSGYPDQTYDSWVVRGVSAYSGGLWLAALRAGEETARILGDKVTADSNIASCSRRPSRPTSASFGMGSISATTRKAKTRTPSRQTSLPDSGMPTCLAWETWFRTRCRCPRQRRYLRST